MSDDIDRATVTNVRRTDWARDNPTLTRGEKYTDHTVPVRKKGDGKTPWKDLPIASPTEKP
jgi:hypothetical protein